MRLRHKDGQDTVHLNPFGTYSGPQRKHPSRGNGSVGEAFVIVAPQSRSLAPAYNGAEETAMLALLGYEGLMPQGDTLRQACAFADGTALLEPENSPVGSRAAGTDCVRLPVPQKTQDGPQKLHTPMLSGALPGPLHIAKVAFRAVGQMLRAQRWAR